MERNEKKRKEIEPYKMYLSSVLNNIVVGQFVPFCFIIGCAININAEPYAGGLTENGVGIHIGGGVSIAGGDAVRCPKVCTCSGSTVDCSHRGLTQVPRRIPTDTERL